MNETLKNIILVVADSLRRDAYEKTLKRVVEGEGLPFREYVVTSENSCTELSLPWMLTGLDVFSPSMNVATDLRKLGYRTTLIHSNPVVDRFRAAFQETGDVHRPRPRVGKKFNRLRHEFETRIPGLYRLVKEHIQANPRDYLPYARAPEMLSHVDLTRRGFTWMHLMDPHTPYYPKHTHLTHHDLVAANNHQISAVRGYYTPKPGEAGLWWRLYIEESAEMSRALVDWLRGLDLSETTVIVTSDHGEEFGEHGHYGHKGNRFNPENIMVPFLVVSEEPPRASIEAHRQLRPFVKELTGA